MDEDFGPAALAIVVGDADELAALLDADPGLATRTSTVSHPTLLQLVACEAANIEDPIASARLLVAHGADTTLPLTAAAGCGSRQVLAHLLDCGAPIDGDGVWTPLDEALYWAELDIARWLREQGAALRALSTAAGLGDLGAAEGFFEGGRLTDEAGPIASPFADTIPDGAASDEQSILDHAFVMAVNAGQRGVAALLLGRGAQVNARPPGYHWHGAALHAAVWRGDEELVRWLLQEGADPTIRDGMVDSDALGWARHHHHDHLVDLLEPG